MKIPSLFKFKEILLLLLLISISVLLSGCGEGGSHTQADESADQHDAEPEKGPHRGRLLRDGDFTLELAIFETGVPPEFRAWATKNNRPVAAEDIDLQVTLTRLGDKLDEIAFTPLGDALVGDMVVYEPHSFRVTINAVYKGSSYHWEYDNFEGRTKIETAVAEALEVETLIAQAVVIEKSISVYGQVVVNLERSRKVTARFDGLIKSVSAALGERVTKGQKLARIESNESLQAFTITAPISGVISQRNANEGEHTNGRELFTIINTDTVWAEFSVFPADLPAVKIGAEVNIIDTTSGYSTSGKISQINLTAETNQAVKVRVVLDNKNQRLPPGRHLSAKIIVGEHHAQLAVKRSGLQPFRDFTVVYALIGEEYEVRMLELGLQAGEWAEVLGGLDAGTRYVSENSYVIKADIEKSGASHDH
ncbi:MAG: efflux RND transporter periplasmic adaptor subunit [Xanthomonadales bacterium]|nr:efflux RND transporter periplasmic adaptor subunit [Xanthomonadales bacterium]